MAHYGAISHERKECDFYLRGACKHGRNCSFAHPKKERLMIIFEDSINKGYLIGQFVDNEHKEAYIPGFKMNEFYSNTGSIMLDNHTNKIYEVTLNPCGIHPTHQRYLVSTIIKKIDDSTEYSNMQRKQREQRELRELRELREQSNLSYNNNTDLRFKNAFEQINANSKRIENSIKTNSDSLQKMKNKTYSVYQIDEFFKKNDQSFKKELESFKKELQCLKKENEELKQEIQSCNETIQTHKSKLIFGDDYEFYYDDNQFQGEPVVEPRRSKRIKH